MAESGNDYDVAIIGGGASGTALLYTLAKYTDISRVVLVEKYSAYGSVNSNAKNNSQTLHVGDIETNYPLAKAIEVKPGAMMVKHFVDSLPKEDAARIMRTVQKMVLGVGNKEAAFLEKRFTEFQELFPQLQKLDAAGIAKAEPEVMHGRKNEPVLALYNPEGYAVNYGLLAEAFAEEAKKVTGKTVDTLLGREVARIWQGQEGYVLETKEGDISARVVVVDADAYSLGFAKSLGYGENFSLIPVAGNFYFSRPVLRGRVYRVQDPRMPFAAVHGDPDLTKEGVTRFGPTARFYPVLEARKSSSMGAFFAASGLHRMATWISFASILFEPARFWYLFKNLLYEVPFIGMYLFSLQVKKIVPTLRTKDISRAEGYGGMRLQRVNTDTRELLLGEGKIIGKNIIFNMTPSPGASVCLYNAMRDAEHVTKFLGTASFRKERMKKDLCDPNTHLTDDDVSLTDSYAS